MPTPTQRRILLGGNPTLRYTKKVQALLPLAYWPLAESGGTTAIDASGNGRNGTYTSVTLGVTGIGDGRTAASFNGSSSLVNVFSSSIQSAFNSGEGSLGGWVQVSGAGVWTDTIDRKAALFLASPSNHNIQLRKKAANNTFNFLYSTSATQSVDITISSTAWFHVMVTWSISGNAMKAYLNGVQQSTTQTGLATFSDTLLSTRTVLGAGDTSAGNPWSGNLAHWAVWSTPLAAASVLSLATVP